MVATDTCHGGEGRKKKGQEGFRGSGKETQAREGARAWLLSAPAWQAREQSGRGRCTQLTAMPTKAVHPSRV